MPSINKSRLISPRITTFTRWCFPYNASALIDVDDSVRASQQLSEIVADCCPEGTSQVTYEMSSSSEATVFPTPSPSRNSTCLSHLDQFQPPSQLDLGLLRTELDSPLRPQEEDKSLDAWPRTMQIGRCSTPCPKLSLSHRNESNGSQIQSGSSNEIPISGCEAAGRLLCLGEITCTLLSTISPLHYQI